MAQPSRPVSQDPPRPARRSPLWAWLDFGPRAGIHTYLGADLVVLVIAVFLGGVYVWVDRPGPADAGARALSGLLVALYGPRWARLAGVATFGAVFALLVYALVRYGRWLARPRRESRARRRARG